MIQADEVSVASGSVQLLAPVSFHLEHGESLIVRGRNGAGKSTLLRLLAGILPPTSGTVLVGGAAVNQRDKRFRGQVAAMIGMPPLAPELTVGEHLTLVAVTWYGKHADEPVAAMLDALGLTPLATRFPHELSSGQTQLFGLAMVLVRPAAVLLLDEPEQRLDPEHVELVGSVLRRRRAAGDTVVLATHSATLAAALGGQSLWLEQAAA